MKLFFILTLSLIGNILSAQSDTLQFFEKQQKVYVLGDSINIRKTPDAKGEIVGTVSLGTPLTILDKSSTAMNLNGTLFPWYLVRYNGNQKGYIWGGKIAMNAFKSSKDPAYSFYFGIEKNTDTLATYQIRVANNGKEIQKLVVEGYGTAFKGHTCKAISNQGLQNVDDIILFEGYAESCGDAGGATVLFWGNNQLHLVKKLSDYADVPYFSRHYFIYPADMEGLPGLIIEKEETGEYVEEEGRIYTSWDTPNVKYEVNKATKYKWDGQKLLRVK